MKKNDDSCDDRIDVYNWNWKVQAAEETSGLTIKPLTEKSVDANPYMVKNDASFSIHDC